MDFQCIFASSKYYKQASASAERVAQPLGYDFLSQKQQNKVKVEKGELIKKILFDKPLIKQLSNKRTPQNKIAQHLFGEDRKKYTYLSAHPLSLITRTTSDLNYQLSQIYAPNLSNQTKNVIDFVNTIHSINKESFINIFDYALSKFIVFYDGSNIKNLIHILNLFDKQFLEYQIRGITTQKFQKQKESKKWSNKIQAVQFDQKKINEKEFVDNFLEQIKKCAKNLDLMNQGVQFFIGDRIANFKNHDILKEQIQNLEHLQYYLYLLCNGVLADGQNALIKLRGTIRNKTTDFLYLYRLIFNKISLMKPSFSNFLSSEKYLICEGFVAQNALQLRSFLNDNFDLLKNYGEQRLLVNPQMIFREQVQGDSTKNFNDSLITRGLKQILDLYLKNSNIEIYPPKTSLIQKLTSYEDSQILGPIIEEIQKSIPSEEQIKNQDGQSKIDGASTINQNKLFSSKKQQVQQKQAGLSIFDFIRQANEQKPSAKEQKKQVKREIDEQEQLVKKLNQKYEEQERIRQEKKKQKKEQQKKQKQQKKQRQQDPYNSRFDYAQY